MTEAQKKKIINTYNIHISKVKEDDKNNGLWNRWIGFQNGYDSILDILGYFQVFDIEGKCIEIRPYNKEKDMKKIFISMPMRGRTDEQIKADRENAIAIITSNFSRKRFFNNEEIEIIDSLISTEEREKLSAVECLGRSISMLGKADYIVILGDISNARGCQIEKHVAQLYGIPIITL